MSAPLSNPQGVAADGSHHRTQKLRSGLLRSASPSARAAIGLSALIIASTVLRLEGARSWLWMDEGVSVGMASHPAEDIVQLLRQDGSPPLYYLLLHGWMKLFGRSEAALHSLSLLFAIAAVPVAFWAGTTLFGRRAGWICSALAGATPYLTVYGREARMYTLMVLLALVSVAMFLHSFALGRRRYLPLFVASSVLLLYTHYWAFFLVFGLLLALLPCWLTAEDRRRLLIDAGMAFGCMALLFLPWTPTLLYQVAHTGAPWSSSPVLREALSAVSAVLGDEHERVLVALVLTGGVAVVPLLLRPDDLEWAPVAALIVMAGVTLTTAWVASQVEPSWSPRYFGVFLPPLLLVAAAGLVRDGKRGLIALALIMLFWVKPLTWVTGLRSPVRQDDKSNVKRVAAQLRPVLRPGDLVVSAEIEQVPVLHYYLPPGLRYATPDGPVANPRVIDWREARTRLTRADSRQTMLPLLDTLPVGAHVVLVCPRSVSLGPPYGPSGELAGPTAPADSSLTAQNPAAERLARARRGSGGNWFGLAERHCRSLAGSLPGDPRLRLVEGPALPAQTGERGASVQALTFEKIA